METFNDKRFVCECGKEFVNAQSFNGHKCHCEAHQRAKHGSLDYINQIKLNSAKKYSEQAAKKKQVREEQKLLVWISEQHTCEKCGKIMTEKYGSGRFCSDACARSRVLTEDVRNKISDTLAITNGKVAKRFREPNYCTECGTVLSERNISGFCSKCSLSSPLLKDRRIEAGKKGYETRLKNGTHHGWQSRSLISYAEQFWIDVLNNNNIPYTHEYVVRKADGINNYFLDFYIEVGDIKLDLEIDGKQHKYEDRHQSDIERDEYLTSLGYAIYRIDWNEIKSEDGKTKMKEKIDAFLEYYTSL